MSKRASLAAKRRQIERLVRGAAPDLLFRKAGRRRFVHGMARLGDCLDDSFHAGCNSGHHDPFHSATPVTGNASLYRMSEIMWSVLKIAEKAERLQVIRKFADGHRWSAKILGQTALISQKLHRSSATMVSADHWLSARRLPSS